MEKYQVYLISVGMNTDSTGYENIFNLGIMRGISKKKFTNLLMKLLNLLS